MLPGGLYTHYWDTNGAPVYVSGHGLEVSNHWGPVDVHTGAHLSSRGMHHGVTAEYSGRMAEICKSSE